MGESKVELILSGGPVWCGLAQGTTEALAVHDGKVLAAAKASDVEMLAGPATRRIDLRGRLAMPAFHDAHMHLMSLGRRCGHMGEALLLAPDPESWDELDRVLLGE